VHCKIGQNRDAVIAETNLSDATSHRSSDALIDEHFAMAPGCITFAEINERNYKNA